MSSPFVLRSPEQQVADAFRERMRCGAWNETLPGIPRLVAEFRVGRPTIQKAIRLLVESGDILPPIKGRPMRPALALGPPANRRGTLIVHNIAKGLSSSDGMRILQHLAEGVPQPVTILEINNTLPAGDIVRKIAPSEAEWILLAFYETEVGDRLHRAGRRVINLGARAQSTLVPRVTTDAEAIYRGAFREAFAAGHHRVCLPLWRCTPDAAAMIRGWVAAEFRAAGRAHSPAYDTPIVDTPTPEALHHCIEELFRLTPPTALIIPDLPQWIATTSTLARLRLRTPEDVSTIVLTGMDEIRYANPRQARFQLRTDVHLDVVRRMMAEIELGTKPESVAVPPLWVPGPSLAAPPKTPPRAQSPRPDAAPVLPYPAAR